MPQFVRLEGFTLSAHAPGGYFSCPVCVRRANLALLDVYAKLLEARAAHSSQKCEHSRNVSIGVDV